MARRFRKKAGLGVVSLPGMPGLGNDTIVEGDEYARFCPAVLEEVFDEVSAGRKFVKKTEAPKRPPRPPEPVPEPEEPEEPEEDEGEPPNMEWLKKELVEYAEGLGLDVSGMTKQEILDAIEEEEGS